MKLTFAIFLFLLLGHFLYPSYAGDVLFVDASPYLSNVGQRLEFACEFYGLDFEQLVNSHTLLTPSLKQKDSRAIVITSQALSGVDMAGLISGLKIERSKSLPLLILGITPETKMSLLSAWSDGAVVGCTRSKEIPFDGFYKVADLKAVVRQLAGQQIPFNTESVNYLVLEESSNVESIIQISKGVGEALLPVLVKTIIDGQEVFFLTQNQLSNSCDESSWEIDRERFLEIAPIMMFLQYTCGERCWHSAGQYANLTIDDPWLTEPYGHLSYVGLLKEMEKMNFHATIAFIPWNYDRSEPDVVSLFRDHPDRFSICIHGNNHDHYEFYKYQTGIKDPWPAKPLSVQEANIKQALARMEEFKRLTGLPYDSIMVFPHGIAPAKTLGLLKRYNFLATLNAGNVPLGCDEPNDAFFWLRPVTLNFEKFASLTRHSAREITQADIAIDLFLDNPLLFYGHHDLFQDGIDSFNEIVEVINGLEPSIEWQSLGYLARHLYLQRIRDDGNYDVRAFCKSIELKNMHKRDVTYFVRKEESFSPPIRQVTVDGEPYPYEKSGSNLSLTITIPPGESRLIDIEYQNDLELASVDISKNDPRVNRLRKMSDFRDITLSKNVFGRAMIYTYYETDLYKLGLKRLAVVCFVLLAAPGVGGWCLLRHIKRERLKRAEIDR